MTLHTSPLELLTSHTGVAVPAPEKPILNIDKARQRVRADREEFRSELDEFFGTVQRVNEERSDIEALTQVQVDAALARGERSFDNIQKQQRLPGAVSSFLSLFNKTYDFDFQKTNLERSYFDLSAADIRLKQADRQRQLFLSGAKTRVETAAQFYGLSQEGLVDQRNALRFGYEIQGDVRKDLLDFVTDQSDATITKWMQNPASLPVKLQGKFGLVQLESYRRISNKLNVKTVEQTNALQAFQIRKTLAQEYMDQFTSVAQLKNAARNPDDLPPYVKPGNLLDEAARQEEISATLTSARLANEAKEFTLFNVLRVQALSNMNITELEDFLSRIEQAGGILELQGVPYRTQELINTIRDRKIQERELIATQNQNLLITTKIAQDESDIATIIRQFDSLNNGIRPRTVTSLFANYSNIRADLQPIIDNPDANSDEQLVAQTQLKQAVAETLVALNDYTDKVLKEQFTDLSRPGATEWLENDGNVRQPSNAMAFYLDGANDRSLDHDLYLGAGNRALVAALVDIQSTEDLGFSSGPNNTIIIPQDASDNVMALIDEAVIKGNVREETIRIQWKELFIQSIAQVTAQIDAPPGAPGGPGSAKARVSSLFRDVINIETRQLSQRYTGYNEETEQEEFNSGLLLSDLANINIEAQELGIIGADASVYDIIFRQQIQLVPTILSHYRANPTAASFKTIVFGPNDQSATKGLYDSIRIAIATMPKLVSQERQRRKDEAARLVAMAQMSKTRSEAYDSLFSTTKPPRTEPRTEPIGNRQLEIRRVQELMAAELPERK